MTDPRLIAFNGRVAADELKGQVKAEQFVKGESARISSPIADLRVVPNGNRERQLLHGEQIKIYEELPDNFFVQADKDQYVGYVSKSAISRSLKEPTHKVIAPVCHAYPDPDFKSEPILQLTMGASVVVLKEKNRFCQIEQGWISNQTVSPMPSGFSDPVTVAETLIHAPYLWGGNSALGIDCSGLVQLSCTMCQIDCPADSDLQAQSVGTVLGLKDKLKRGDLIFWKGHVAWVAAPDMLFHANTFHMAAVWENLNSAIKRIDEKGDGMPTQCRRLR
jgi:cell wall-associated NlpC family hydrolase